LFLFMGFVGMFLGQVLYIFGVIYTTPDTASMFQPLVPVSCTIVAIIMKVERSPEMNKRTGIAKVFGICLATGGALLMTYSKQTKLEGADLGLGAGNMFGFACLFGNILSASIWIVTQKKYIFNNTSSRWREYPINVTAWTYFFGAVWMALACTTYANQLDKFHIESANVIYCLLYAIFITSTMCYALITWCNMQVNSSFVTASWPLQVMFCLLISYIVLGETLVMMEMLGGFLIICALLAVTWSNYKECSAPRIVNGKLIR